MPKKIKTDEEKKARRRIYQRNYRKKNPEKIRQIEQKYREKNPERVKEKHRKYKLKKLESK